MPEQIPVLDLFSGIPPEGSASHSSLWPTPVGQDTNNLDPQEYLRRKKRKPNGAVTSLNVAVGMWPTPDARDAQPGGFEAEKRRKEKYSTMGLQASVQSLSPKLSPTAAPSSRSDSQECQTSGMSATSLAIQSLSDAVFSRLSSLEDFRVKISHALESGQGLKVNDLGSGPSAPAYLASYDRDSHCLKTSQVCLLPQEDGTLIESYLTWPKSGILACGKLYRLPPLALRTVENESGSCAWQIPMPSDVDGGRTTKGSERQGETGLRAQASWPTARREDGESCGGHRGATDSLKAAVRCSGPPPSGSGPQGRGKGSTSGNQAEQSKSSVGKLRSEWVEALQGFPIGWTDIS